ncbi:endonuclease/exonuclease/phosphatase family protein [Paeniglutamicibacter kerguelensis]|uniref:Endonuclease/exonuclease/phosphatase (EEP) superfamily protein YafD n=2 Tax=Paeniglutamicibacter kerguelensis TaxID=254788 RepID=A0ABS4XFA9_9MICC|nr:endonuclease/exonuclease/phosphatase family protein [Paeniglutamicibacter kerguelensis]MBP2386379.1 endonuclease/exonuclease/phosphatase (EEP) superfamily protein YafD [Paeniglutamicibacter kerguelensis]
MHPLSADPVPPLPRRRTWAAGIGWALLVPVLLLLGLRLTGLSVGTPWVQLLSLTPLFIVPSLGALLFFALARRTFPALVAAGAAIALAVLLVAPFAPAGNVRGTATQDCSAPGLRMMSLNARLGRADAAAVVETVRREQVQLLAIQEFTPALGAELSAAGLDELLPHTTQVPEGGAAGAGIFSQFPLTVRDVPGLDSMSFENPTASFTVFGSDGRERRVEITNVHTFPPLPDAVDSWRHDLAALAAVNTGGGTRILAGDFNATYDHREFRDLLHANADAPLSDASTGGLARLQPTWPREHQYSPGIVIDHVLTSADVSTCDYATGRIPGSDHAAVLVTLNFG